MMNIGLIGSASFYKTYKQEFIKYHDILVHHECSIEDALNNTPVFESLLLNTQYLFFEETDAATFRLITAALKNGKNIFIDKACISMAEMSEMHNISSEGNLKCLIFNSPDYYKFFQPLNGEIQNPFFIEMTLEYSNQSHTFLAENISNTLYECMQNLQYIFKSDIRQINVKPFKVFSGKTDLISVQLDFSNGCSVNIKISDIAVNEKNIIHIYQPGGIFIINLSEGIAEKQELANDRLNTTTIRIPEIHITEKKVQHFLASAGNTKTRTDSILDNYHAMELSSKIIKKINSLYE